MPLKSVQLPLTHACVNQQNNTRLSQQLLCIENMTTYIKLTRLIALNCNSKDWTGIFAEWIISWKIERQWSTIGNYHVTEKTPKTVVKRTVIGRRLRFFFTMFSTSAPTNQPCKVLPCDLTPMFRKKMHSITIFRFG